MIHTYESYNKDSKEDPEGVADDVHEHDGGEGDGEAHLPQPLAAFSPTEDVARPPDRKTNLNKTGKILGICFTKNYLSFEKDLLH